MLESLTLDGLSIGLILILMGAMLMAAEAAAPGFFVGAIGTAMLILGAFALVATDDILFSPWAPVIIIGGTFAGMAFSFWFYSKLGTIHPPITTVATSLVGRKGIVTVETDPDHDTRGKVKIGSTVWSATSDVVLEEGTKVKVVSAEGVHVNVKPLGPGAK